MVVAASFDAYLFALLAALFLGIEPGISKRGLASGGTWLQSTLVILSIRTVAFWVVLAWTAGKSNMFHGLTPEIVGLFIVAGIVASGIGRVAFFIGVDRVGSSVSNALANIRPLFAVVLAIGLLGEDVSSAMGLGIVVLVCGLVALSVSRGGDISGWKRQDLMYPVLTAAAYGLGNVLRRVGFTTTPVSVFQAITINETAALVAMLLIAAFGDSSKRLSAPPQTYKIFTVSGIFASFGLVFMFEALERGPVSIVDPISATAPLFTTLFAFFYLRDVERITRRLLVGVLLIIVGIVLIMVA